MPTWYNAKVTIVTIDKNNPCIASVLCRGYCFFKCFCLGLLQPEGGEEGEVVAQRLFVVLDVA